MNEVDLSSPETQAKIEELKEKLGIDETGQELTPEAIAAREDAPQETEILGKDINWDDYELEPNFAHFYPRSKFIITETGEPAWVVDVMEYHSEVKSYLGKGLNKKNEPSGLGEYLTFMVNGPQPWGVSAIFPNGSGLASVVLHRKVRVRLPDPKLIEKDTKVDAPTDAELKEIETESIAWAHGDKNDQRELDDQSGEKIETP